MMTLLTTFVFSAAVLLVVGLTALILARCPHRRRFATEEAATVTGACGDTMMLQFSVKKGRIVDTAFKTKGCAYSFSCLQAAADAARNRTLLQALDIDAAFIARKVGHIPQDHKHCATLAVQTLHTVVDRYMQRQATSGAADDKKLGLT
jgi:nitrogen fixation NifU-like protein